VSSFSTPHRSDARRNRERILVAAAEALAEDPSAGLERIARRAGVSRPTLYAHFAGREALLDALTARSVTEMTAALRAASRIRVRRMRRWSACCARPGGRSAGTGAW